MNAEIFEDGGNLRLKIHQTGATAQMSSTPHSSFAEIMHEAITHPIVKSETHIAIHIHVRNELWDISLEHGRIEKFGGSVKGQFLWFPMD